MGGGYPSDAIMTIETNPEVLAVCNAQGWCANKKYMTASEAAAITSIGAVFYNNTSITHFEEFEYFTGVTSLANNAFRNCTNLKTLVIPINVTSIGNDALRNSGITKLNVKATNTSWGNAYTFVDNKIEYFYSNSYSTVPLGDKFSELTTLELDSNVRTVGGFMDAIKLTTVNIAEGATTFNDNCFKNCSSLVSITLPSTTSNLIRGVFHTCANLTSVTILATTPPTGGNTGYLLQNSPNAIVYVPNGSVSAYQSVWTLWANRIQAIPT